MFCFAFQFNPTPLYFIPFLLIFDNPFVSLYSELQVALSAGVSRGKGQDLFLRAFHESLQLIQEKKLQLPSLHAIVVGSDMNAQTKFEMELRKFVTENKIQDRVHFVNKTLAVAPYLASIDVLVQNSQVSCDNIHCQVDYGTELILHYII